MIASESAPFTITLFGPMRVLIEGQPLPHLRSRKALWLLALLALRGERPVEREWLAGTLWPDVDQDRAAANLRVVLSELRRALGSQGERLKTPGRHTLSLDLDGADVDVLTFDAAVAAQEPSAMERAVALYRGPLLEGCTEEWVPQERAGREQDCLHALQALADAALATGDSETAAGYYRRSVGLDPWREAAQRGLMQALSQSGDSNAALEVYQSFVRLLRKDDPRAAPDEKTTSLYTRLRTETRRPTSSPNAAAGEEASVSAVTGYLPQPLTDLVGREDERLEVAARLRRSRLVTLTGPGGIGKTRLAIEVAAEAAPEFPDGAWLAALESLSDRAMLSRQIAVVLGLKEEPGRTCLETVTDHLRAKRLLLVLDNCEHLLDESAQVAARLLRECAGLRILTTSREALGITGETAWAVPGLSAPDPAHLPAGQATLVRVLAGYESVQLFVERAQAIQKTFALTRENARAVAEVCARLAGLPLAVELAAARVKSLTVEQIASRLGDHLTLLTGGDRTGLPRRQTLRGTLDWSYDLLSERESLLLRRLSVFAGGCDLEAAESVCAGDGLATDQILNLLTTLVDKSLVLFDGNEGEGRYRLLEMVRQYAAERLGDAAPSLRSRHLDWALDLAEKAEPLLKGAEQAAWLRRLEAERDNLRAALDWCEVTAECEAGLRLAGALWRYWYTRGDFLEARSALGRALACSGANGTAARAKVLNGAGAAAYYQNDYEAAQALFGEALRVCRQNGDPRGIAESLNNLGNVACSRDAFGEARAFYEESLSLYQTLDDRLGTARTLSNLGNVVGHTEPGLQRSLCEQSVSILRELGDRTIIGDTLWNLAALTYRHGDFPAARALAEECLALAQEAGNKSGLAEALLLLGNVCAVLDDPATAQSYYEESLRLFRATGNRSRVAWATLSLGYMAKARNDTASARALYQEGRRLFAELGERGNEGMAINTLGEMALGLGETADAQTLYRESAAIFRVIRDASGLEDSVMGLAAAQFQEGKVTQAVCLWAAADAMRGRIGKPLVPEEEREKYDGRLTQARAALGETAFAAAWAGGSALTSEQAAELTCVSI